MGQLARKSMYFVMCSVLLSACINNIKADTQKSLKRLSSDLDTRFNPDVPPIDQHTNTIDVNMTIGPMHLLDLVDATQILKFRTFVVMTWKNISLAWNASDYPNVSNIEIAPHKIWSPAVMLVNAAVGDGPLSTVMPVTLYQDGSLLWQNVMTMSTTCKTDLSRHPFDNQTCELTFTQGIGYRILLHPSISSNNYNLTIDANGEWEAVAITSSIINGSSRESVQVAAFQIHLSRKYLFHVLNLIFPMCLLSFFKSFVFLLPASSGEKMGYLMAVFVSNALFLSLIHDSMPSTSDSVPDLSLYLTGIQLQGFLAVAATISVKNIYHRHQKALEKGAPSRSNKVVPLGSTDNAGSSTPASLLKLGDSQPSNRQCMMRKHDVPLDRLWDGIFFVCSIIFSLTFLLLLVLG